MLHQQINKIAKCKIILCHYLQIKITKEITNRYKIIKIILSFNNIEEKLNNVNKLHYAKIFIISTYI